MSISQGGRLLSGLVFNVRLRRIFSSGVVAKEEALISRVGVVFASVKT